MKGYRAVTKNAYSTLANDRTIDKAPGAHKPIEDIIGPIADAVDIIDVIGPIFNFKASWDDETDELIRLTDIYQ